MSVKVDLANAASGTAMIMGNANIPPNHADTITEPVSIPYGHSFRSNPEVFVSLSGFRQHIGPAGQAGFFVNVSSISTDHFQVSVTTNLPSSFPAHGVISWIAVGR